MTAQDAQTSHGTEKPTGGTGGPVLLFPGQGGFDGPALSRADHGYSQVRAVFDEIDAVTEELSARRLSDLLLGDEPADPARLGADEPWVLQLAVYGSGLAAHRILTDHGLRPGVLVGHGLGEITALVAAGGYSVGDGARIVIHRSGLLRERDAAGGAMLTLSVSPDRAAHLVGLVDHPLLSVASENHDAQTVLSGPREAIDQVKAVAGRLGIGYADLAAGSAPHTPSLATVAPRFAAAVRDLPQQPLAVPVHSPILGRRYGTTEPLPDLLADHLTRPAKPSENSTENLTENFSDAVRALHGHGERTFVETGGGATLSSLVHRTLSEEGAGHFVTVLPTLYTGHGDELRLPDTLTALREAGLAVGDCLQPLRARLAPELTEREFAAFWAAAGRDVVQLVSRRATAFRDASGDAGTGGSAKPVAASGPTPAGSGPAAAAVPDRGELMTTVRALYARALSLPEGLITPYALLGAELGICEAEQSDLLSRALRHYGLPELDDVAPATPKTLNKVVDLITDLLHSHYSHSYSHSSAFAFPASSRRLRAASEPRSSGMRRVSKERSRVPTSGW
ncbi:acyltransferase domain-containing protein [Streptomyces sp. CT34]|uniref:acyltransferase domain-containing protein n=1 Tax=Streptomyces sp. CT34 TaxID=1553907 RepID=UPI0005BDA953